MKTSEQLKGAVRNMAREKGVAAQEILQAYMFERFLERLSLSEYRECFILKGGLLIASIVGIGGRTTMDMDTTVKGIPMNEERISFVLKDITNQPVEDGITFSLKGVQPIRKDDEYENFRASFEAVYGRMKIPMKLDITTGDQITPSEIEYPFPMLFEKRTLAVMAYPLETILAEKYETIIHRNLENTRARDYYDLYILFKLYAEDIKMDTLRKAVYATAEKRQSLDTIKKPDRIIKAIERSFGLKKRWQQYQTHFFYAKGIDFEDIIEVIKAFASSIQE